MLGWHGAEVANGGTMMQTQQHWSTAATPAERALDHWRDIVREHLLDVEIDSDARNDFSGCLTKFSFGPLKANYLSVSRQRVRHGRWGALRATAPDFHLIQIRDGAQFMEHGPHAVKLEVGDCFLMDCRAAFRFDAPAGVQALVLELPGLWLRGWVAAPEDAVGRIFGRGTDWGGTLSSALRNLTLASSALPQGLVAEQIAALLSLATTAPEHALTTHQRSLLRRVLDTLRQRYHEPELDPGHVATALGISRRYIHTLLAGAGTTFCKELYAQRLDRARRMLADARFDGVGVCEVAWSCGFNEPSHFTRRFREYTGHSPSAYRLNRSGDGSPPQTAAGDRPLRSGAV
jgi:AraC-like DNA-binding protein